jgi:hypothetical protein
MPTPHVQKFLKNTIKSIKDSGFPMEVGFIMFPNGFPMVSQWFYEVVIVISKIHRVF